MKPGDAEMLLEEFRDECIKSANESNLINPSALFSSPFRDIIKRKWIKERAAGNETVCLEKFKYYHLVTLEGDTFNHL